MPTELRFITTNATDPPVVEVWNEGELLAQITPADTSPGIRIVSKRQLLIAQEATHHSEPLYSLRIEMVRPGDEPEMR